MSQLYFPALCDIVLVHITVACPGIRKGGGGGGRKSENLFFLLFRK